MMTESVGAPRRRGSRSKLASKRTAPFYSHPGCLSVHPELMIRMLLVGSYYSIRAAQRLCQEVVSNPAYRWFCHLGLENTVPHYSSFSVNRHGPFGVNDALRKAFYGASLTAP
jgi:transposase